MYIADKYGGDAFSTPEKRAKYAKWVVWSNAQLDGLCFGAVPGDHRVRGSSMGNTQIKAVATLEEILGKCEWLVDDQFSVADVAVGSYLNCAPGHAHRHATVHAHGCPLQRPTRPPPPSWPPDVPVFFPNTDLSGTPNTAAYMLRCAERPAFADAFGQGHADTVKAKAQAWLARGAKGGGPQEMMKKMFG